MTEEQKIKAWKDTLFNPGEFTCMGHRFENKTYPVEELLKTHEYCSINPMKKGTTRKGINVTRFSNFLFEMDQFSKKEQAELIKRSKLPWSAAIDSGNKSLHFILALHEDLGERSLYTAYFKAINEVLLKYGANIDDGCKDPGRFTRAPYGVNTKEELVTKKPHYSDRIQKVAQIKSRVYLAEVDEWLELHGVNAMDFVITPTLKSDITGSHSNAETKLKVEWVEKYFMKQDEYKQGNKHNYQVKMAYSLLRTGLSVAEVDGVLVQMFGEISTGIGSTSTLTPSGDPIYVPTMEERREYYKLLDDEEQLASNRSGYNRDGIDLVAIEARPEDMNRYEIIGTEYFKIDSLSEMLLPWSRSMFEKLYGSRAIPSTLYDKFGYKPDYLSEQFPVALGADGKTRNMFTRPTYKIEPGPWDTIKGGLMHGFRDQYDLILLYCAVTIAFPEAKLPNLWFIGAENKGKSAVVAIIKYLVGLQNVKKVSCKALESDFTDFLGGSQLVLIEEAGNWKAPREVMSNLKDWTTEYDTQWINPKYGKKFESPINCKFIFTSNDWDSAPVSGEASRIWFIEINEEPSNKVDNYYAKIQQEMGGFVDYLVKEIVPKLKTKLNSGGEAVLDTTERLYFSPKEYETDAKRFVKDINKSPMYSQIVDQASDFFERFPEEDICFFDFKSIMEACDWKYKTDPGKKEIKLLMKQEWNKETTNNLSRQDSLRWVGNSPELQPTRRSQWFQFTRQEIIVDALFNMEAVEIG